MLAVIESLLLPNKYNLKCVKKIIYGCKVTTKFADVQILSKKVWGVIARMIRKINKRTNIPVRFGLEWDGIRLYGVRPMPPNP